MKYGFSTIGCPEWLWKEVVSTAKDLGYDGIELRGLANKEYLPSTRSFSIENCSEIRLQLEALELSIPCLSTSAFIYDKNLQEKAQTEMRDYINLAPLLDTPFVRVLADKEAVPGKDVDEGVVLENLREISSLAEDKEVMILVESNGVFADSRRLAALMEKLDDPNIGVLWDIHHPYRFFGESPAETYKRLQDWICYVHIKDSLMENGKVVYKMLGYGDIPLREALHSLQEAGYDGFIVLEWLKRWVADLEDPGVVFAHFPFAVKRIMK
ncbi:MAG: sugar phosphate isomerase/epimerase [Clostridiales bacterium]|nr:sugar phosphate isomerase/epimerase [Clostridiales bacterium]